MREHHAAQQGLIIVALLLSILAAFQVSPCFAYSSSIESSGGIISSCNSLDIVEGSGATADELVNSPLSRVHTTGTTTYVIKAGTISEGLSLVTHGPTGYYYALRIDVAGADQELAQLTLKLTPEGSTASTQTMTFSQGSCSFVSPMAYSAEKLVKMQIDLPADVNVVRTGAVDEKHLLTLGSVTFTMVCIGTSSVVPSPLSSEGTTFLFSNCKLITGQGIDDSSDEKIVIDKLNPVIKDIDTPTRTYDVKAENMTNIGGVDYPTILVKQSDRTDDNLVAENTSFNLHVTLPKDEAFVLKFLIDKQSSLNIKVSDKTFTYQKGSGSSETIYIYYNNGWHSTSNIAAAVDDKTGMKAFNEQVTLTISGDRANGGGHPLQFEIIMPKNPNISTSSAGST